MADKIFIGTGAAIDLSVVGNYSPSGVPVNGDRLFFINGLTSDKITAGLTAMSAVTLAALYVYDTYAAQMGTDALSGGDIQVGYNVMHFGYPSGVRAAGSGGPAKAKINAGSVAGVNIVYTTGNPTDLASGGEALRWRGTHATGNQFTVHAGSVGIATQDFAAAVVNDINIDGGTLNVGINATARNMDPSGTSVFRHNGLTHASGYIKQAGGTLYTTGTTLIPTIHVAGKAFLNHRATGDDVTTLLIRSTGECDLRQDPRAFDVGFPIQIQQGGRLYFASPTQLTGGWETDGCDLDKVTVRAGGPVNITMAGA